MRRRRPLRPRCIRALQPQQTESLTGHGQGGRAHFTSLHFTSLHFTSLHFTSLHFTSLHFTSLHFTSLHFIWLGWTWTGLDWTQGLKDLLSSHLSRISLLPSLRPSHPLCHALVIWLHWLKACMACSSCICVGGAHGTQSHTRSHSRSANNLVDDVHAPCLEPLALITMSSCARDTSMYMLT